MTAGVVSAGIPARLEDVRRRVEGAARAAGRDPGEVLLVAVSKTRAATDVRAAYAADQRDFGENYVQELLAKRTELADLPGLRWHMIGHVQTNKARVVARVAHAVHSVDSVRLARELGRHAADVPRKLEVFVEVNVGGEASKTGCAPEALDEVLDAIHQEGSLSLRGLMTVPPHTDNPFGAGKYFDTLVALRDAHGGPGRLPGLSMGMTHDMDVAIAHGATVVRVGTAIFGDRG